MKNTEKNILIPTPEQRIISTKTREHYGSVINLLHRSTLAQKDAGHLVDVTPLEIVDYLFSQRARFRPQTFLLYRSALVWWIPTIPVNDVTQRAWAKLHETLPVHGYKDEKGQKGNTTLYSKLSSRKRTVSQRRFNRLLNELRRRLDTARTHVERKRAAELQYWLLAGLATGLRPVEWSQAHWRNKEAGELNVITAKRKLDNYGLPHIAHLEDEEYMPIRVVVIDDEDDIPWVDLHMKSVQAYLQADEDNVFSRYYDNNRLYLRNVCRAIFPSGENVTLYMLRGQFAANRKISGQPREELAEEMGCSARHTSTAYGKQIYGHRHLKGKRLAERELMKKMQIKKEK